MPRTARWTLAVAALVVLGSAWQEPKKDAAPAATAPASLEIRVVADRARDAEAADRALTPEALKTPPKGCRWAKLGESTGLDTLDGAIVRDVPAAGDSPAHRVILLKLDRQNLTESDVIRFREVADDRGAPAIEFRFHPSGARRFGVLTREHLPDAAGAGTRFLAIVLDGTVVSAPAIRAEIRESARIDGLKAAEIAPLVGRLNKSAPDPKARDEAIGLFEDEKVGLAIRWALPGPGPADPPGDSAARAAKFKGEAFDADAWVKLAKAAGAKFLIVPARDRSGFCYFDSRSTKFDAMDAAPIARDPLKLLADACRKGVIPLHVSFALDAPTPAPKGDHDPKTDPIRVIRDQVRELCVAYGDLAGIAFEGADAAPAGALGAACAMVRELRPSTLIVVDRAASIGADFDVQVSSEDPARIATSLVSAPTLIGLPVEGPALKSTPDLVGAVVEAAGRGASVAIQVQAAPDGSIPKPITDRLAEVGAFLGGAGVSIYATRPGPIAPMPWGVSTRKGDVIYLHVLRPEERIGFPTPASPPIKGAALLGDRKAEGFALKADESGKGSYVLLPGPGRSPIDTIIVLNPPEPAKKAEDSKKKSAPQSKKG